jgi:hypothetical protein
MADVSALSVAGYTGAAAVSRLVSRPQVAE